MNCILYRQSGFTLSWFMRYCISPLFLLAVLIAPAPAQQDSLTVCFQVYAGKLPDSVKIYISGNQMQLGNWQPDQVPLHNIAGSDLRSLELKFPAGEILEYKFTRGTWTAEAVTTDGTIPRNYVIKLEKDTTLLAEICCWKNEFQYAVRGRVTGTVRHHAGIRSDGLEPRDLAVWLPPEYQKNIKQRYPVLYMHDGQNLFDPRISTFGIDWQIDETADSLIRGNKINPLIIVGIYNTPRRSAEYAPNDTGRAYMKFVVEQVKPLIDITYRTLPDREHTASADSSLGGLISFMLLWEYPQIFSAAACFSPAFKIGTLDYVSRVRLDGKRSMPVRIYLDNGGMGLEEKLQPGINEMLLALQEAGYKQDRDFFWYKDSTAGHHEEAWARRVWRPLLLFWGMR